MDWLISLLWRVLVGERSSVPKAIQHDVDEFVRGLELLTGVVAATICIRGRLRLRVRVEVSLIHPPGWPPAGPQEERIDILIGTLSAKLAEKGVGHFESRVVVSPMRWQTEGILGEAGVIKLLDQYTNINRRWYETGEPATSDLVEEPA